MTVVWGRAGQGRARLGLGLEGLGCEVGQVETYMGPLIIRAISTLTSATNSCRSGYGSSTSGQLACRKLR